MHHVYSPPRSTKKLEQPTLIDNIDQSLVCLSSLFWILRAACLLQGQLLPADLRPTGFHQAPLPGERCLDGRLHVAPMRVSPATRQRLGGDQGEDVSHSSVIYLIFNSSVGIGDQELLFKNVF